MPTLSNLPTLSNEMCRLPTLSNDDFRHANANTGRMTVIRIRRNSRHAEIMVPKHQAEPSCETKLKLIAWLVSDLGEKLGVGEIELTYETEEGTGETSASTK